MATALSNSIFFHRELRTSQVMEALNWEASLFSQRSPDKRSSNEDAALFYAIREDRVVMAVADGCGGMRGGERASRIALQTLEKSLGLDEGKNSSVRNKILDGIELANRKILALGIGAACTIAVVEFDGRRMRSYHVGDSMIMVLSRKRLRYQSISHSPIGYAVESGWLGSREAMFHNDRHLVSNVLGIPEMRIELGPTLDLEANDRILVSSDGLFDNLTEAEIRLRMYKNALPTATRKLASLATRRMKEASATRPSKPDDLTFVAFHVRSVG